MLRLLVVALALVGGTLVPQPASAVDGQPEQTAWHDGPCDDNVGITIVVDFGALGGGVNVRCAPGPVTSGLDALDRADVAWEGARRFPSVVCRIAGAPGADVEPCNNTPPADAYWSYWMAPRGGAWCYSTLGAGSRVPPPGSIEGWSFSSGTTAPPRFEVPAAVPGQPPNPIRAGECGAPAPSTTTTTTTTTPTTAPSTSSTTLAAAPPLDTEVPDSPTPTPPSTNRPRSATTTTSAASSTTTTTAAPGSTTTSTSSTSTTSSSPTTSSSTSTTTSTSSTLAPSTSVESTPPLGTVDLSDDGQDGGGFGAATAAGIASVGGLAGTAIWIARRRRLAP